MENSRPPIKILLVKMSSMGDIFHTFPAISDLKANHPDAIIDWVVEDGFKEIVDWHPAINKAIPISLRRWMKERGGKSWREARLVGPDMGKYAWRQFVLSARLPAGNYTLASRATDAAGNVQPETRGENVSGYNNSSWIDHAVKVTVA